jgi:hypothetical protein
MGNHRPIPQGFSDAIAFVLVIGNRGDLVPLFDPKIGVFPVFAGEGYYE